MSQIQIPNGWSNGTISKVTKRIGGGTPSKSNQNYYTGKIPWLTISIMHDDCQSVPAY